MDFGQENRARIFEFLREALEKASEPLRATQKRLSKPRPRSQGDAMLTVNLSGNVIGETIIVLGSDGLRDGTDVARVVARALQKPGT
jgi:hypothetical protein